MDAAAKCAAESIGTVNLLYGLLLQTIIASQCGLSSKELWPKDYGPTALAEGNNQEQTWLIFSFVSISFIEVS